MSVLEEELIDQIHLLKLEEPIRELRFHPPRRWRFDLAYPNHMVAIDVEGATWANGRHNRGSGFEADCEKYNTAALDGWLILRVTSGMIRDGRAIGYIETAIRGGDSE